MNPGPVISIPSGENLAIYRRVRIELSTGKAVYADASDADCVGFALRPTDTTVKGKDVASIQMLYAGISYAIAGEAITKGKQISAADDGKVKDCSAGETAVGVALEAASADGDQIRVIYFKQTGTGRRAGSTLTATTTLTAEQSGSRFYLSSATEFATTLPAAAAGLEFEFVVSAAPSGASYTIVTASSANVINGHVLSSDLNAASDGDLETSGGDTITLVDSKAVAGDIVRLNCDGTNWFMSAACSAFDAITITTAS